MVSHFISPIFHAEIDFFFALSIFSTKKKPFQIFHLIVSRVNCKLNIVFILTGFVMIRLCTRELSNNYMDSIHWGIYNTAIFLFSTVPSGSPDIQEALNVSSTAILVTWTEVNARDRNGIIITYEVDYQPANRFNDSDIVDIMNTTNTSIVLQNLHEFVQYNITVRAYTSIGPGPFSEHELSITQEARKSLNMKF